MSVRDKINQVIQEQGFIEIDEFMKLALSDNKDSYYRSKNPIGEGSDFITAPEISQMFGEMIGVWAIDSWAKLGKPDIFNLVELGAGKGTLLRDLLRIAKTQPKFLAAANIYILDINEELINIQKETLANYKVTWVKSIEEVPNIPSILIANEFFDALPIKQYVKIDEKLHERIIIQRVGILEFGSKSNPSIIINTHPNMNNGDIIEESPESLAIISKIANHLERNMGTALIIDYGYDIDPAKREPGQYKDTLQAIKSHKFISPLDNLGEADVTAHVDFRALKEETKKHKINVMGAITQANLLLNLGIDIRLQNLQLANPNLSDILAKQYNRLVADNQMGSLFKAIILNNFLDKNL